AGSSCLSAVVTLAVCVIVPGREGVTTKVTVALEPGSSLPIWATTWPPLRPQVPALAVVESNATPAPIGRLSTTFVAGTGPAFDTVAVKVRSRPATTVLAEGTRDTDMLTAGTTDGEAVA